MNRGPTSTFRHSNRAADYIQSSFNISEGVTQIAPTLIFKGVVIDVDFEAIKSTTFASMTPPFSVCAKIIGMDDDVINPSNESNKIYYPPLFPMHTICIPEIGEEVLILKENSEASSQGYYIGRVNDSSPLNISYARDYVATNDAETNNRYRYGFSFDVRELREKFLHKMPEGTDSNFSIPMTYGDVVQQGRTKTYLRHSFNRNNKKGVLEQGIRMDGQLLSRDQVNSFDYERAPDPAGDFDIYLTDAGEDSTGVAQPARKLIRSVDPSIGITKTKSIHLVDSSIKRLGDYTYQSFYGNKQTGDLEGDDKGMIVNIAEEIYNISSRNVGGALYRQVLGEKLVTQQQQSLNLMKEVMNTVSEFASSTQILLDAFLDHTHALPKIELNLEKTIDIKDRFRTPPIIKPQPNLVVNLPNKVMRVQVGYKRGGYRNTQMVPQYQTVTAPGGKASIPQPPKIVSKGRMITKVRKQEINFEAIIGGSENPRFTAPVQTDKNPAAPIDQIPGAPLVNREKTELGMKTATINTDLEKIIDKFTTQRERLNELTLKVNQFLSKNQFVN